MAERGKRATNPGEHKNAINTIRNEMIYHAPIYQQQSPHQRGRDQYIASSARYNTHAFRPICTATRLTQECLGAKSGYRFNCSMEFGQVLRIKVCFLQDNFYLPDWPGPKKPPTFSITNGYNTDPGEQWNIKPAKGILERLRQTANFPNRGSHGAYPASGGPIGPNRWFAPSRAEVWGLANVRQNPVPPSHNAVIPPSTNSRAPVT